MSTPENECGPDLFHEAGTETTTTSTRQDAPSDTNVTAVPLGVSIIGADALHRLAAEGYRISTTCQSCGGALIAPKSVAARMGPVCAARTADRR